MFDGNQRVRLAKYVPSRLRLPARKAWALAARLTASPPWKHAEINEEPLLVVGNQKSGTSAIAGLLASATGRDAALDLMGELIRPTVSDVYAGSLTFSEFLQHNAVDFTRGVVKDCHMTFLLPELIQRFPAASVVFVVRDPRDNIRSILNRLNFDGRGTHLTDAEWSSLGPGWRLVFDGSWLGIDDDGYIAALARRWDRIAALYMDHAADVTLARYEEFRSDRPGYIDRLLVELGLDASHEIEREVETAFQPAGDNSASWEQFYGSANLKIIETICNDGMHALGYQRL